jgi:AmmeMemoRadiSam system protein B
VEIIRHSVVSGYFYPGNPKELKDMINGFLKKVDIKKISGEVKGLVEPHAGYVYSGLTAAYGYKILSQFNKNKKWKIVLLGPSHHGYFPGAAMSTADYWLTPLGKVKVEKTKIDGLLDIPEAHLNEHSLEVQLPFLQCVLNDFSIIPILIGEADPKELSEILKPILDDSTIIIVSSDLSHFHSYREAKKIDKVADDSIPKLEIKKVEEKVEACGKTGILTVMNIAKEMGWKGELLHSCNSGDVTNDKSQVVGYGCYGFFKSD